MMLCLLFVGKAHAQEETLTVCDGTSTNGYVPVYGLYMDEYTRSEMVYPAEMLEEMTSGDISSIVFYIQTPASDSWGNATFNVYLTEISNTTLTDVTGSTDATVVYSGPLDGTGDKMAVEFSTPYHYDGGNLLVGFEQTAIGTWKSCYFYGVESIGSSTSASNSSSLNNVGYVQRNFLPKATFNYESPEVDCPRPKNLVISDVTAHEATATWDAGGEETMWLVGAMAVDDSTDYQGNYTTEPTYTFTGLSGERQYQVAVVAVCDAVAGEVSEPRRTYFTTEVSCQKPAHIEIEATAHEATVTWSPYDEVPYTGINSNFENDFINQSIADWTTIDADGDGNDWMIKPSSLSGYYFGHDESEGFVMSYSYSYNPLTPDNYLVSPLISVNEDCKTVSFWACAYSDTYPKEHFGVAVSTTSNTDASTFTTIDEWTMTAKSRMAKPATRNHNTKYQGTWYNYTVDLSEYIGQDVYVAIRHFDVTDEWAILIDDITIGQPAEVEIDYTFNLRYRIEGETEWTYVNDLEEMSLELAGLNAETTYEVQVQAACGGEDGTSPWVGTTFTTDIACPKPTDLTVVPDITSATVTWQSGAGEYNLCYRPVDLSDGAIITLEAHDVWGDGSGYQMLLDADATAYGTIIPETGGLTTSGDASADVYNEFEYKIPVEADGALTTQNMVYDGSVSILVPAGTYDWCITNPTPGDRMWIAGTGGNVGGRQDDYEFEAGVEYVFVVSIYGQGDGVDVTISAKNVAREYEWTCVEGITDNTYTLEGLDADVKYEVKVQAVCGGEDGESLWTNTTFTTLPSCPRPTNVTVTNITNHEATVSWTAGGEEQLWNVIVNGETYETETTSYDITGLDAETEYTVQVVAVCAADDASQPESATFTTLIACEAPTNVQVAVDGVNANVTWNGSASEYNLRYKLFDSSDVATVTLTAGDVWGDGTGYQMLLDADATAYGTVIPETGGLTTSGDVSASVYAEFEYKIPETADGSLSTSNVVINNSISIEIPAGTYDWCITNPTPGDRMWIASSSGNVGGRVDDYVFDGGMIYEFVVSLGGQNDQVDLTITQAKSNGAKDDDEWTYVYGIEDNAYTIERLAEQTAYKVEVQAVCGGQDGESEWTKAVKFVTGVDAIAEMASAGINVWNRTGEIRVDLEADGNYTMNVVNMLGQTVMAANVDGQGSHIVKHNLTAGIYVVTLSNADNTFATKIVVR